MKKTIVFDWSVLSCFTKKTRFGYPRRFARSLVRWLIRHDWEVCVVRPLWLEWFSARELIRHLFRLRFPFVKIVRRELLPELSVYISFREFTQKKRFFFLRLFLILRKLSGKKRRIFIRREVNG